MTTSNRVYLYDTTPFVKLSIEDVVKTLADDAIVVVESKEGLLLRRGNAEIHGTDPRYSDRHCPGPVGGVRVQGIHVPEPGRLREVIAKHGERPLAAIPTFRW